MSADVRNWREERARSDFDRKQVLTIASVWDLPVGHGQHFLRDARGVVNQIIGGWQINSIYTFMSGEPFSVRSGVLTSNGTHVSRALVTDPSIRAQLQTVSGFVGPGVFANSTGFAIPPPGSNGSGRNIFTAPSYWNFDIGIIKTFQITERMKLQFRTEMFNALNHPNFSTPRANISSASTVGTIVGQVRALAGEPAPRQIDFSLRLEF